MQEISELILAEVRELRAEYNAHAWETESRLPTLESQMKSLVGNGQPGRIVRSSQPFMPCSHFDGS